MTAVVVNGVAVNATEYPSPEAAAGHELLRQRAVELRLAAEDASRAEIDVAIEQLLAREVSVRAPGDEECRRYYEAHPEEFTSGELAFARHILFQVTPRVPVPAIRARAELALADLSRDPSRFEALARELSNCPSSQHGGILGQLGRGDTVPEFERALFNGSYIGLHPQLVKTRFGFHVLSVDRREPGRLLPLEAVRERVVVRLYGRIQATALALYMQRLAASAEVRGAKLDLMTQ